MVEGGGFEPPKLARQIYSLIPLATREPLRKAAHCPDGHRHCQPYIPIKLLTYTAPPRPGWPTCLTPPNPHLLLPNQGRPAMNSGPLLPPQKIFYKRKSSSFQKNNGAVPLFKRISTTFLWLLLRCGTKSLSLPQLQESTGEILERQAPATKNQASKMELARGIEPPTG
jgi:hypothetical protein